MADNLANGPERADRVSRIAERLPLCRADSADNFGRIAASGRILSQDEAERQGLARFGDTVERALGTSDFVFTYCGAMRYPDTTCGFVFSHVLETRADDKVPVATPFDSGGIVQHLRPNETLDQQRAFLRSHELPVPHYRSYLRLVLSTCFADALDYVSADAIPKTWPWSLGRTDARGWTFEVRFPVQLSTRDSLVAVFVPIGILRRDFGRTVAKWRKTGVEIRQYKPLPGGNHFRTLQRLCETYVKGNW